MRFDCGNDWEMESVVAFHHLLESQLVLNVLM